MFLPQNKVFLVNAYLTLKLNMLHKHNLDNVANLRIMSITALHFMFLFSQAAEV